MFIKRGGEYMSNVLTAKERTEFKGSNLTKLRNDGNIPAVVYGNKNDSKAITINSKDLSKTIKEVGRNGIISLDVEGTSYEVMLSEYQKDALKNRVYHADFLIVDMSSEIEAQVRVELVGDAKGVKEGGVLQQSIHELNVTAKPKEIPESIEVDVTGLEIGDTLTIADIKGNYKIANDEEEVIASVLAPRQEEEVDDNIETETEVETSGEATPEA